MTILTEKSNPETSEIDLMSAFEIAQTINREDKKVALAVESELESISKAIRLIADSFLKGGRLAYFGAGTSGRLGVLDASECYPTFGVDPEMVQGFIAGGDYALRHAVENAEDSEDSGFADLQKFKPRQDDVVVGISASGNPRYVVSVLKHAKLAGSRTIGISSNPEAAIRQFSDIFICPVVGQEAVTGSSRMKSGTAQKMVLNMLSTGAMILIGKTYKNYMIDVRMVNEKLVERGRRFVSEICGISVENAAEILARSGGSVKTACVMSKLKCGREEAEQKLKAADGILRKVIE